MGKLSRRNIIVITLIILCILIVLGVKMLKPTPIDDYGFYYKNSFGVYTNYSGFPEAKKINIPAKLKDADPYGISLIHIEWSPDDIDFPVYAYAKSAEKIYFNNKMIEGIDAETFEHIGGGYSKDSENIFYQEVIVEGVDYESFQLLGDSIAVDMNGFFYRFLPVLKKTDNQTYMLFNPDVADFIPNDDVSLFIQDPSGIYKVGEKIKVREMDGKYHQAKNGDRRAMTVFMTENMTVRSTHILY